jgi:hypothetical protein
MKRWTITTAAAMLAVAMLAAVPIVNTTAAAGPDDVDNLWPPTWNCPAVLAAIPGVREDYEELAATLGPNHPDTLAKLSYLQQLMGFALNWCGNGIPPTATPVPVPDPLFD